jgi:ATP-dependent Clp protease adaptor protein ClpS
LTELDTKTKTRLEKPRLYKVILNNDDFTPQDFVVQVLTNLFGKTEPEAYDLMMQVHKKGKGIAGIYSKEIAEHKVFEVGRLAKHYQHPLLATYEPED